MKKLMQGFQRFMYGRYGMDGLGKFLFLLSMLFFFASFFEPTQLTRILAMMTLICMYVRCFSKNVQKRYRENCVYYQYVNKIKAFFAKQKSYHRQRKTHHIYSCPNCRQKIRIPKGKGKVMIRCSRCGNEFMKNSR